MKFVQGQGVNLPASLSEMWECCLHMVVSVQNYNKFKTKNLFNYITFTGKESFKMRISGIILVLAALLLAGCAGPGMQANNELTATRQILNEAKTNKLDKQCPEEFKEAMRAHKEAVALYRKCKCQEALDMARDAMAKAKALCPAVPVPPPAPCPEPLDSDGDGILDSADQCPNTPRGADVNSVGCWIVKGLRFDFDSAVVKPEYYPLLERVAEILRDNPSLRVEIQGHTDSIGPEEYNMQLSQKRAQAVADYLASHGISADRMTVVGVGEADPVAGNDTEEGRAKNRRVQIKPL